MIKEIPEDNFSFLCVLYSEMNKSIIKPINEIQSIQQLLEDIKKPAFRAYGLYCRNNQLVGFITGYAISDTTYYCSGLYNTSKRQTLSLIRTLINEAKSLGFTKWETICNNPKMTKMYKRLKGKPIFSYYGGDL